MSVCDYIKKFDELSRFAPHMVSTNELKVNQFLQGLKAEIYRDIKMATGKGVPYTEVAEKALEAEEAELKVVKALEIRRNINMARRNANFGKSPQPGFDGGKRKFPQGQGQRQDPLKHPATGQQMQSNSTQKVTCPKCGKPHKGECLFGSKVCYTCGKTGHFSRECPSTSGE